MESYYIEARVLYLGDAQHLQPCPIESQPFIHIYGRASPYILRAAFVAVVQQSLIHCG